MLPFWSYDHNELSTESEARTVRMMQTHGAKIKSTQDSAWSVIQGTWFDKLTNIFKYIQVNRKTIQYSI